MSVLHKERMATELWLVDFGSALKCEAVWTVHSGVDVYISLRRSNIRNPVWL